MCLTYAHITISLQYSNPPHRPGQEGEFAFLIYRPDGIVKFRFCLLRSLSPSGRVVFRRGQDGDGEVGKYGQSHLLVVASDNLLV